MGSYVPTTAAEREEMLAAIGVKSLEDLYQAVPQGMLLNGKLNIPGGMSELEVREAVTAMAEKNKVYKTVLRGAGAYRHFIPAVVKSITSREELVTCYTPYQAEISQGVLQGTFEFQTMICELTGMDVANASHYDGATAAAEAIPMCRDRKRTKAYVSACVNPQVIGVMQTYCFASNTELTVVPAKDGRTDLDALKAALGEDAACFYLQQPNYFGQIEDARAIGELVHAAGAKFVMGVNPIACALLPTPCEMGADIAVGDGQPLGQLLEKDDQPLGIALGQQPFLNRFPLPRRGIGEAARSAHSPRSSRRPPSASGSSCGSMATLEERSAQRIPAAPCSLTAAAAASAGSSPCASSEAAKPASTSPEPPRAIPAFRPS